MKNRAHNSDSMFAKEKVVKGNEVGRLFIVENGIGSKIDIPIESKGLSKFSKSFESEGLKKIFKKSNKILKLSHAL